MECKKVSASNEDIFEAIRHIRSKKKQRPDIKDAFNYLTKLKKMEDVSFDFFKPETINLEKQGTSVDKMFNGTDSFYIAEKKGFDTIQYTRTSNTIYGGNTRRKDFT